MDFTTVMEPSPSPSAKLQAFLYFHIYTWVQSRYDDIHEAFNMEGGWEGWAQVELGLWLNQRGFTVEREQRIFKSQRDPLKPGGKKVDMLIQHQHGIFGGVKVILELKCEGLHQDVLREKGEPNEDAQKDNKQPYFVTRILKDVNKFDAGGSNILDEHRGIHFCCIGISLMSDCRDYVLGFPGSQSYFKVITADELCETASRYGLISAEEYSAVKDAGDVQSEGLLVFYSDFRQKA